MELTDKQLDELCERSAGGEGVRAVLREFGCDNEVKVFETLEWLKQHQKRLQNAKAEYRQEAPMHKEPEHQVRKAKK